eukprot:jgi/Mesvir1/5406/Mv25558-RA.1
MTIHAQGWGSLWHALMGFLDDHSPPDKALRTTQKASIHNHTLHAINMHQIHAEYVMKYTGVATHLIPLNRPSSMARYKHVNSNNDDGTKMPNQHYLCFSQVRV